MSVFFMSCYELILFVLWKVRESFSRVEQSRSNHRVHQYIAFRMRLIYNFIFINVLLRDYHWFTLRVCRSYMFAKKTE